MQNIHCIKISCGVRLCSKNIFKGAGRNNGGALIKPGLRNIARYLCLSTKFCSCLGTRIPTSELRKLGDPMVPAFSINKIKMC